MAHFRRRASVITELVVVVTLVVGVIVIFKVVSPRGKALVETPVEKLFPTDANGNPVFGPSLSTLERSK